MHQPAQIARQVILRGISWQTYERLLSEHGENTGTRFVYHRGMLEIMIVSLKHEKLKDILVDLFTILADAREVDYMKAGSTTFKREDLTTGFEPDACFYITHAAYMRHKDQVNLNVDPPPDLVIEIDITHESLSRFPLFAAVGVPEIWRYDGSKASVHVLDKDSDAYHGLAQSAALPGVTGDVLTRLTEAALTEKRHEWLKRVHAWMRGNSCQT
ncbi:MAG: Uma2 family endonuclease [Nitrococcus sp.]|nr:Uma2 family endonuclease [Nitrococcus sp.]